METLDIGSRDDLVDPAWAGRALERIRQAYRALGAEENVRAANFDGAHDWHGGRRVSDY